jgi:hypothetical protein
MPNHRCKILTVAEEMLKKKTERYIKHDKSWMEKYEPGEESGNKGREITENENKRREKSVK